VLENKKDLSHIYTNIKVCCFKFEMAGKSTRQNFTCKRYGNSVCYGVQTKKYGNVLSI